MKRIAVVLGLLLAAIAAVPSQVHAGTFWPVQGGSYVECLDGQNTRGPGKHLLTCYFRHHTIEMTTKGPEYEANLILLSYTTLGIEGVYYNAAFQPLNYEQPCFQSGACTVNICRPGVSCVNITSSFVGASGGGSTTSFNGTWYGWDVRHFALYFQTHGSGTFNPTRYNDNAAPQKMSISIAYVDL
jgi:hypothetical protein